MVFSLVQRENKKEALPRAQFDSGDEIVHARGFEETVVNVGLQPVWHQPDV